MVVVDAVDIVGIIDVIGVVVGLSGTASVVALILSLLSTQMGYLCLNKAFFTCSSSLCSSSALVQTVVSLCVRVLNTLYLAERL